jgi:hypothetical protein
MGNTPAVTSAAADQTKFRAPPPERSQQSSRLLKWLRGLEVDLRSLALCRIGLGLCLTSDLLRRIPEISDFYTDDGILPRAALNHLRGSAASLNMLGGDSAFQMAVFGVAVLFAVGFTVGYRTRLCAVASFLLLTSIHVRNPFVLHGGDAFLRLLLLWCIFAPMNLRLSADAWLNPAPRAPVRHLSAASIALLLQICGMYWYAASEKVHPVWLGEQTAVYYTLQLDILTTPLGRLLLDYPAVMRIMTTGTMLLEAFGPLVAILPFRPALTRSLMVASFTAFHFGLGLTLQLELFVWICISAWLAFIPTEAWDWLGRRAGGTVEVLGSWLARAQNALIPRLGRLLPPAPTLPGVGSGLAVLALLFLTTLNFTRMLPDDSVLEEMVSDGMLEQRWRMFAPYPTREDGWYIMEGVTADGRSFDLWNDGLPSDNKPVDVSGTYRDIRWSSYLMGLRTERKRDYRPYFARYLCRRWNSSHPVGDRVRLVDIRQVIEYTPEPGGAPIHYPQVLWLQPCVE